MKIETILPERVISRIEQDLVVLTKQIVEAGLAEHTGGFLGGEYGYGADYRNDVFMMHSFCWCDEPDCPWCAGCECSEDACTYTVDGKPVAFQEWVQFFRDYTGPRPSFDASKEEWERWNRLADEADSRCDEIHIPDCQFCLEGVRTEYGGEPGKEAPNFWFYGTSGEEFKVWWYKYIGRSMEYSREIDTDEWGAIFKECMDSLGGAE